MRTLYPSNHKNIQLLCCCLAFLLSTLTILAQGTNPAPAGDYTFTTQAQVNAFNNGQLYTSVDGNITISATGTITNLTNFSELIEISQALTIQNYGIDETTRNPLNSFSALEQVGDLLIFDNSFQNPGITSLSSSNLTTVTGRIEIGNNLNLASVSLPDLTSTGGSFIFRNNATQDILSAPNLAVIGNNLNITDVRDLVNLNGLEQVSSIGGSIILVSNDQLTEIDGLGQNDPLTPSTRFAYTVEDFIITDNPTLGDLVPVRITVTERFIIADNPAIGELGEFLAVDNDLQEFTVVNNRDLDGLNQVLDNTGVIVVQDLIISNNSSLDNIGGQGLNVQGNLTFSGNPLLTRLPQFGSITSLSGNLTITNNAILAQTTRLANLSTVGGDIVFADNPIIPALNFLNSLTSAGSITINNNDNLLSLDGFQADSLNIANFFFITNNDDLGDCCRPFCQTTVNGAQMDGFNSAVTISGNTGECQDKQTAVNACETEPGKGCLAAAPVEWLAFTGSLGSGSIDLEFSTATESDNDYFQIERSVAGGAFVAIGQVDGAGNSQAALSYSFSDYDYSSGLNYYRIRQVDFDGTEAFSNVIVVNAGGSKLALTLFPNPANGSNVTLQLGRDWNADKVTARIYSVAGQFVREIRASGGSRLFLPTADLQAGMYAVRVSDGNRTVTTRLTVR